MDVDFDFKTTFDPLDHFGQAIRAAIVRDGKLSKHPAGVYLQSIPKDPVTDLAAIPHKEAEQLGYFKFDCLHLSPLDDFAQYIQSKEELRQLVDVDPNWDLLLKESVVEKLMQIHRYHKLISKIKPHTVEMLADAIALIRPAKRHLIDRYVACTTEDERDVVRVVLYTKPEEEGAYYYKKPHAVAYAITIVVQLHLIQMGLL